MLTLPNVLSTVINNFNTSYIDKFSSPQHLFIHNYLQSLPANKASSLTANWTQFSTVIQHCLQEGVSLFSEDGAGSVFDFIVQCCQLNRFRFDFGKNYIAVKNFLVNAVKLNVLTDELKRNFLDYPEVNFDIQEFTIEDFLILAASQGNVLLIKSFRDKNLINLTKPMVHLRRGESYQRMDYKNNLFTLLIKKTNKVAVLTLLHEIYFPNVFGENERLALLFSECANKKNWDDNVAASKFFTSLVFDDVVFKEYYCENSLYAVSLGSLLFSNFANLTVCNIAILTVLIEKKYFNYIKLVELNLYKQHLRRYCGYNETINSLFLTILNYFFNKNMLSLIEKDFAITVAEKTNNPLYINNAYGLSCKEESLTIEKVKNVIFQKNLLPTLNYHHATPSLAEISNFFKNSLIWTKMANQVLNLLTNVDKCLDTLKSLETDLSLRCEALGLKDYLINFSSQGYIIGSYGLLWPQVAINYELRTEGILNELLLEKEQRHGLNVTYNNAATFGGFVNKSDADSFVAAGNLFQEFNYIGNPLHGKYSHRLQWYIILCLIEKGEFDLDGLTVPELLAGLLPQWLNLFDMVARDLAYVAQLGWRSPMAVHSTLLLADQELPVLCGYLRKVYVRSLDKISKYQITKFADLRQLISYYDAQYAEVNALHDDTKIIDHYTKNARVSRKIEFINRAPANQSGFIFHKPRVVR